MSTAEEPSALEPTALTPPSAPSPRTERITLERRQTRELLEVHITLPVLLEALEFAITAEPELDPEGAPVPPSRFRILYDLMLDPSFTPFALAGQRPRAAIDTLMSRAGVKLPEILALIGQRNLGMAIMQSGTRLAKVIDGLGEAAEPRDEPCMSCNEKGYLSTAPADGADLGEDAPELPKERCPDCRGRGSKRVMGNLDAAKLFVGIHGGTTSAKGAGAGGGASSIINVMANATVRSSDKQQNGPENVTARVQKLIEQ